MDAAFAAGGLEDVVAWARAEGPARAPAPVHRWNPPRCGAIDIRIRADGVWVHEGTPIGRIELARLFATVLRRDSDGFFLVTPAEKLAITVDDAPFVATTVERRGDDLVFATSLGERVAAGPKHPIRVAARRGGEPRPYLMVRDGLEALIARSLFYELVELASERMIDGRRVLAIASGGVWFALGPAA